ncbi:hypothetical protein ACIBJI_42405, partial [Nocardia sp. NPDC050408]|uniref:hypothetical protein n=1 Tax=unclassified Nocardia TaxID=2637762 RepID=UPI00344235D9
MSAGSFYQYTKDKGWVLVDGTGSTPEKAGYYYAEDGAGNLQPYYCKGGGDYRAINYKDKNVIDADGNLYSYKGDNLDVSHSDVSDKSSGNISNVKVDGFDPPKPADSNPSPKTEDKLPALKDRRDDRLEPGEKLAAPGSKEVTDG